MHTLLTLCIVQQEDRVLLGMKKRGFGAGRWNGFGGKVHNGESIEAAAVREIHEEAGIIPTDLIKLGILEFEFLDEAEVLEVHIFKSTLYNGEIGESEEMRPQWFFVDEVPFETMWEDDIFWFPFFIENKKFKGRFHFDAQHAILEQQLREVAVL